MSKTSIKERIAALKNDMKKRSVNICIVSTADYHQSEYVGDYFKVREFFTGFTGSAGTAVFTETDSFLWTDARYFLQAEEQLSGSGIHLMKMGEENTPTIDEFLRENIPSGGVIVFDGRTVDLERGRRYEKIAEEKGGSVLYDYDPAEGIWTDRPALSDKPAFLLEMKYAGETVGEKLKRVRNCMEENKSDVLLSAALDDTGWLLNIRGRDVEYFPLLLSYALVTKNNVELYVDEKKIDEKIKSHFKENNVIVYPYEDIYRRLSNIEPEQSIWIDPSQVNYMLFHSVPDYIRIVEKKNPIVLMKAVKNDIEVENIRKAHLKDGVAHTKFMYWLKNNVGKIKITEMSASDKLEELRREQGEFISPSFEPISAYGEHAAVVHYTATAESDIELKTEGLFLTDTGGNYYQGSTDITRTVALGKVSEEEKKHFTIVLAGMLNLAAAKFLYGCTGVSLDYAAREPFWRENLDFKHGTGHGVGYLGNIHEPPARFHWKYMPNSDCVLEENMVITDEPGLYIAGSHGIRTENELLVRKDIKNEYGQFMRFEMITYVPIDLDAVDPELLTAREKELLNQYHEMVYQKIAPELNEEERIWLRTYTRAI